MTTLHTVAQVLAERLLNCVAEGFLIALAAWILLRVVRWQSSAMRFAIWFSALVMIAALPFVALRSDSAGLASRHPELAIPSSWAAYMFAGWAMIAALALVRVVFGLGRVRKLRRSCVELTDFHSGTFASPVVKNLITTKDTKVPKGRHEGRDVRVCVSDQVKVPTAIGFFNPTVVLPSWALNELSGDELEAVLLHEMAHLRRWDDWSNLAQKIIRALLFFHPAVWWIDNRLALEREMACDELVLDQTANPRAYAECLVSLAEKNFLRRRLAMAQAAVGRIKHMSLRIARILDKQGPVTARSWKPAVAVLATFSAVSVFTVMHTAPLVGFENDSRTPARVAAVPGNDFQLPASMIVSAGLHSSSAHRSVPRAATNPNAKSQPRSFGTDSPHVTAARAKQIVRRPAVIQAKANQPEARPVPQPTFLVVETDYFETASGVVWTMTVWHVDVATPAQKQAAAGTNPRSI
jgi:Zn-dependent protease with chaperone function